MTLLRWACAIALACLSLPLAAQKYPLSASPDGWARPTAPCLYDPATKDCTPVGPAAPLPVAGKQEAVTLATANTASAPAALYGGTYVLNQSCSAYGTLTLRYRSPDGVTMLSLSSKTAADSSGGTTLQFGSGQVVDVALANTTGCYATLSRVP